MTFTASSDTQTPRRIQTDMPTEAVRLPRLNLRDRLRLAAARPQMLMRTVIAALLVGVTCGVTVAALRHGIDIIATFIFGEPSSAFDTVPASWTALAPIVGSILIAAFFVGFARGEHPGGPAQAMRRVVHHRCTGKVRSFIMQYLGATVAVASGHALGPSGPAVYLGALLGGFTINRLRVPLGTITACGAAAGIASSLDAPVAGVLFAMEVFLLRYTLAAAVPLSVASVAAAAVTHFLYEIPPLPSVEPFTVELLHQLPHLLIVGAVTGATAILFNHNALFILRAASGYPFAARILAAGIIVAAGGLLMPQIMTYSAGLDTLVPTSIGWSAVLLFLVLKFLTTAVCYGCGVPAGLIAPCLIIGATLGTAASITVTAISPETAAAPTLYALICMGAMVGAVVNAPLTSLAIIFELASYDPSVLIPGAVVVVAAQFSRRRLAAGKFKGSIFQAMFVDENIRYEAPASGLGIETQLLNRRVAVADTATDTAATPTGTDYLITTRWGKVNGCKKVVRGGRNPSFAPCEFSLVDCGDWRPEIRQKHTKNTRVVIVTADKQADTHRVYGIIERPSLVRLFRA